MTETADPDRACEHADFTASVEVTRLTATDAGPVTGYTADIKVHCAECGEAFRWTGVPAGLSQARPMCSPDETEMRAPLRPATADPDYGLGIPGFAIKRVDYEPCQTARDWGECVLADGHETWESGMVGATASTSHVDRNGRHWGVAAAGAQA